ncbi:MAG: hypothetical protein RSD27_09590, partial [Ruthenibacterium sp.]
MEYTPKTTMAGALCAYFEQCELLQNRCIDLDFLPDGKDAFCIDLMPGDIVVSRSLRGGGIRQLVFLLRTRTEQNEDMARRIDNSGLFEELEEWLSQQTKKRMLPKLPAGKTATRIEAITPGYRSSTDDASAGIYQIECRLTYLQQ